MPEETTEEQKKAEISEMRKSLNEAKATLADFMKSTVYSTLDETVQKAIKRLAKKAPSTSARASVYGFLKNLFKEPGTEIGEFDLFRQTKKGRSTIQQNVNYAFKKAEPEDRLWIRFDPEGGEDGEGSWILDQIGGEMPDNWTEAMLPKTRN